MLPAMYQPQNMLNGLYHDSDT